MSSRIGTRGPVPRLRFPHPSNEEPEVKKRVVPIRAAVLVTALLAVAACSGGDSTFDTSTTTTAPATTTTTAPTTTTAATTTTSTTTTTTTLVPPSLALEFLTGGLNIVDFGATPDDALTLVGAYLGSSPTFDSGWVAAAGDYGVCPGTEYRQVAFGGLVLKFTDGDIFQPAGTRHFFGWAYDGSSPGITPSPLDVGITVAALQALYPAAQLFGDDPLYGNTFRLDGAANGEQLWGVLTGAGAADTITYLAGGWGCGE
jgi:hypothetical protein